MRGWWKGWYKRYQDEEEWIGMDQNTTLQKQDMQQQQKTQRERFGRLIIISQPLSQEETELNY